MRQPAHKGLTQPGPLVLRSNSLKNPTLTADRDRQLCYSGFFTGSLNISVRLSASLQSSDYILARRKVGFLRIVSEVSLNFLRFPADSLHFTDF